MKTRYRLVAFGAVVALAATACGEPPEERAGDNSDSDFLACMVSDQGGIDDKSFNQTSYDGLKQAYKDDLTDKPKFTESTNASEYDGNVSAMVNEDCGLIVTVGYEMAQATAEHAEQNKDEKFAIVDNQYTDDKGKVVEHENIKPLVFNTQEAAFLAGYAAAAYSKTGKVATLGGQEIPTVTIFMDGFSDGVDHYNKAKKKNVQLLGWNKQHQSGQFVGDFENSNKAKQISDNLIRQGADVLHPVAGPLASSAAVAAKDAGDVSVVWADSDGYKSAPEYKAVILTSVLKEMDTAVEDTVKQTVNGKYSNGAYVGTLKNGGVDIAPFHDFEKKVPSSLPGELEQLKKDIANGKLEVTSEAAFDSKG